MKNRLILAIAAAALLSAASAAFAHGDEHHAAPRHFDPAQVEATPFGQAGNPKKVSRTIRVRMDDNMRFTPDNIAVRKGETVRLVVANKGALLHEMVLGTRGSLKEHAQMMQKHPDMVHEEPNIAHVKPGATGDVVWQFTQAGNFDFACLVPGHLEAGMTGKLTVE